MDTTATIIEALERAPGIVSDCLHAYRIEELLLKEWA